MPLGAARSILVVASREDDGRTSAADLAGGVVATHLPAATARWFAEQGIDVTVVTMGGALEGVCAAGMADAIVDLRETGRSLAENRLRVLAEIAACEALFVHDGDPDLDDLGRAHRRRARRPAPPLRDAARRRPAASGDLAALFPGLAAPTVLPLAGRDDLVAVHLGHRGAARSGPASRICGPSGATGIVALPARRAGGLSARGTMRRTPNSPPESRS